MPWLSSVLLSPTIESFSYFTKVFVSVNNQLETEQEYYYILKRCVFSMASSYRMNCINRMKVKNNLTCIINLSIVIYIEILQCQKRLLERITDFLRQI
jgi:hypothetical protein